MWLLDSDKPDFYNLASYYRIEIEKKNDKPKIKLMRFIKEKSISKELVLREKNQYNAFKEKINALLRSKDFLFIESNDSAYIWLNQNYIVSIASNIKNNAVILKIETVFGYIDDIYIGSRLQLQLFAAKNLSTIITIPNKPIGKDTRGVKEKYDIKSGTI